MNDISNTALVTLKCHIQDAKAQNSILNDSSSLTTFEYLSSVLDKQGQKILNKKIKNNLVKHTALRAAKYDAYAKRFLMKHPDATIVNIGCGLDHRFERVDNGKCQFIDIDFPDIMEIKESVFPATERYLQIAKSVFDFSWMEDLPNKPIILLAEGVFMFCYKNDIQALFKELHQRFTRSEIVFEVFSSNWLTGWKKRIIEFKMQKQLSFGKDALFKFGVKDSNEIEKWSENYQLVEDWSYFDEISPNLNNYFRKIQWTVYYLIK